MQLRKVMEVVGMEVVDMEVVGMEVVGMEVVGMEVVDIKVVGMEVVGMAVDLVVGTEAKHIKLGAIMATELENRIIE